MNDFRESGLEMRCLAQGHLSNDSLLPVKGKQSQGHIFFSTSPKSALPSNNSKMAERQHARAQGQTKDVAWGQLGGARCLPGVCRLAVIVFR